MAAIRRTFFLCRNVRFTNLRFTSSSGQKFPMNINENFGSLAETDYLPRPQFKTEEDLQDDDGEAEHFAIISNVKRPYPIDYQRKIEDLLLKRDLAGALKIFDEEMRENLVKPNFDTYHILIHACGKAGYAYKAQKLLFEFISRGQNPTKYMYTDVFTACAKSPIEERKNSLNYARRLRNKLNQKYLAIQQPVNRPLYNSMIAAFGRCGDLDTAFEIVDEMSKKMKIEEDTYSHLLQACNSDEESGFRLALIVYRRMLYKKLKPNLFHFKLLLRATHKCGIGNENVANDLLLEAMTSQQARKFSAKISSGQQIPLINSSASETLEQTDSNLVPVKPNFCLPNLIQKYPNMDNVMGLSKLETPHLRFQLLGDLDGFIDVLTKEHSIQIDIVTMCQLIYCIEPTLEAEDKLVNYLSKLNIQPDIDFFNQLMSKRCSRKNGKKHVMDLFDKISHYGLAPNMMTFGCVAVACTKKYEIFKFLRDMREAGIKPHIQIMGALIGNATRVLKKPEVVMDLLKYMERHNINADAKLVAELEKFVKIYRQWVIDVESGKKSEKIPWAVKSEVENGLPNWQEFLRFYDKWLKTTQIELPESKWAQYKTKRDKKKF